MTYKYTLTESHIKVLGINGIDEAEKYVAYQNGWDCKFLGVYAVILEKGILYEIEVLNGDQLTEEQFNYILKLDCVG